MIRGPAAHRRDSERDRWEALRRMTAEDSIAVGEALLTSDIMRLAVFSDDDEPRSLAIALGIKIKLPDARGPGEGAGGAQRV